MGRLLSNCSDNSNHRKRRRSRIYSSENNRSNKIVGPARHISFVRYTKHLRVIIGAMAEYEVEKIMMQKMHGNRTSTPNDATSISTTQDMSDGISGTGHDIVDGISASAPAATATATAAGHGLPPSHLPSPPAVTSGDNTAATHTHTANADEESATRTPNGVHPGTHSSTQINGAHDNNINTMPVVFHHGTRQFIIPPLTIHPIYRDLEPYSPLPLLYAEDKSAIVPSMILCVLANNPDILLPLASCQTFLFDPIYALNRESLCMSCTPAKYFCDTIRVVLSVVCTRLRYALHTLYPQVCVYDESQIKKQEAMALELEKGPIEFLESIVRDGLAVVNPIRVLITYLEAVTTHYAKLTLTAPGKIDDFRQFIAGQSWLGHLTNMSLVYGLYLWDSQWVSDDEWNTLVKLMNILTTEIFPEAYPRLFPTPTIGNLSFTRHESNVIWHFKHILACIACCFLHKYRPMKKPIPVPYGFTLLSDDTHRHSISPLVYQTGLASSIALLKQCAAEFIDHLEDFQRFSPMDNMLEVTIAIGGSASPRDFIMSQIELSCNQHGTCVDPKPKYHKKRREVEWSSRVPTYDGVHMASAFILVDRIMHNPPLHDAVYTKITDIFPKEACHSTLIGRPFHNPQFQWEPANRTRDANPSSSSSASMEEEVQSHHILHHIDTNSEADTN